MKTFRNLLALFLTLSLVISMIPGVFAGAERDSAKEYIPVDPYVYSYGIKENNPHRYQYFSPYYAQHNYNNGEKQGRDQIFLSTIYNSITEEVIPAYCMDIFTGAYEGNMYRRLNLENSTHAASSAPLIRAIMLNGFYLPNEENETAEQHLARVNENLAKLSAATGVEGLTIGEAIAGTQLAIWSAAHGPLLKYDPLVYKYPYSNKTASLTRYYDLCHEERANGHYQTDSYGYLTASSQAYLTERIQAVIDYLLTLEPMYESKYVVSEESFGGVHEKYTVRNQDGTYDICLEISVGVDMDPEDRLTLTAMADATHYVKADLVDGHNGMDLIIENVPAELLKDMTTGEAKPITVAIDGMQSASQVIFLEAKNGEDHSQSMVAMDNSYTPVHEEVSLTLKTVDLIPELKVGRSLILESNISINYVIPENLLADYSGYCLYCYQEGEEDPYVILPEVKEGYVYFTFDQLTALNMNDTVKAYLHVPMGRRSAVYDLGEYSVATYAYTMMGKETTPENVKILCANLLRYGAKAQLYKEYKADDLPDAGLSAEQRAYLTDLNSVEFGERRPVLSDLEGATVTWAGSSMSLDSTISVKLVVNVSKYAGDPSELELHATFINIKGVEESVVLNPTLYNEKLNLYAFTITQLNAAELRSELTCRVYANGEAVSQTKLHCADNYGNNKTGTILELCQALFAYVDCAKAVFD